MTLSPELLEKLAQVNKKQGAVKMAGTKARIRKDIQEKVDSYIELDAQFKNLEKQLKALRGEIEPYMDEQNITRIDGTERGHIELVPINRAVISAKYTSYEVSGVLSLLDAEAKEQCLVEVVDKDVLELLVKTGKVPEDVYKHKVTNPSRNFTTRHA